MTTPFRPTHLIVTAAGSIPVQLVDGAAYTQREWESATAADYERQSDGAWTFQGQAGDFSVRTLPTNLEQLRDAILAGRYSEQEMTDLPTFGGEPVEKFGVFSWDATRILRQVNSDSGPGTVKGWQITER